MHVTHINHKKTWNDYIFSHASPDGGFLQMYEWGEFQEAYGRKVFRIGCVVNGHLPFAILSGWQVIVMPLFRNFYYLYIPRPVGEFRIQNSESRMIFEKIQEIGKKNNAVFIRVDGADDLDVFGFYKTPYSFQPPAELIIDITKSETELFALMKPKTRYNIRLAEKHGVKIQKTEDRRQKTDFESFYSIVEKTSHRQGIRAHPKEYYQKMLEVLGGAKVADLFTAVHHGTMVAAQLMLYAGKTAIYLHGGSDDTYKSLMAPYRLHWEALRAAKRRGCTVYSFGGVSQTNRAWAGITRFKQGFSPATSFTSFGPVWDWPLRPGWYQLYRLVKKLRHQATG